MSGVGQMSNYKLVEEITVDKGVELLNKFLEEQNTTTECAVNTNNMLDQYTLQIFEHVRSIAPIAVVKFNCCKQARNLAVWLKKSFTCCNILAPDLRQVMASHGSVYLWDEKQEALEFEENRIKFEALAIAQQRAIKF